MDSGVFQCFASNAAGKVMSATWLQITSMHLSLYLLFISRDNVDNTLCHTPLEVNLVGHFFCILRSKYFKSMYFDSCSK